MTLRARLTVASLAMVLGPLVVGAVFVTAAAAAVDRSGDTQHLDLAANALRTSVNATCDRLMAAAESVATIAAGSGEVGAAQSIVDANRASAVRIAGPNGATVAITPNAPAPPWVLCAPVPGTTQADSTGTAPGALAAVVPLRAAAGTPNGYAYAAQALDPSYLQRVSQDVGATITLAGTRPAESAGKIYDRTVAPIAGQPLHLAISVPVTTRTGLIVVVIGVVVLAAVAAIVGARALARVALRPLDELARAADQIAGGALQTRVPVRHGDEVGQVGAAFNRMTHEMRSYAEALTASRDQLRGNLDVLGTTLSSTHDRPGILRVILASAIAATGAARGVVLLPATTTRSGRTPSSGTGSGGTPSSGDPAGDEPAPTAGVRITVQCSEGFDDATAAGLTTFSIASGVGLLGGVAATAIARCGRVADAATELDAAEPSCATYLAVPLKVPPLDATVSHGPGASDAAVTIGVLALYDRIGGEDFDETDLRTVRTFARHAAVAVDNVRRHDEAQRLSHTDPLTGLDNYRRLQDTIGREISRSKRFGHSMCILMLDLDRFKDVNDTYGHAAGDAVLAEFARRISGEIRGVDLAFRIGGEEFVVLLPETVAAGGEVLAKRLGSAIRDLPMTVPDAFRATANLATVEMPLVTPADDATSAAAATSAAVANGHAGAAVPTRHVARIPITVSVGVAVFPDHGDAGPDVLAAADAALYAAKSAGRDTYRIATARVPEPPATVSESSATVSESTTPAAEATPPARRSDDDAVVIEVGRPAAAVETDATDRAVACAQRAGGASTAGPAPRAPIGR